jgi:hypothetical protein
MRNIFAARQGAVVESRSPLFNARSRLAYLSWGFPRDEASFLPKADTHIFLMSLRLNDLEFSVPLFCGFKGFSSPVHRRDREETFVIKMTVKKFFRT